MRAILSVTANLPGGTTDAQCTTYSNPAFFEISRDGSALNGSFPNATSSGEAYFGFCQSGANPQITLSVFEQIAGTFTVRINLPGLQTFETTRAVTETTTSGGPCPPVRAFSGGTIETTLSP